MVNIGDIEKEVIKLTEIISRNITPDNFSYKLCRTNAMYNGNISLSIDFNEASHVRAALLYDFDNPIDKTMVWKGFDAKTKLLHEQIWKPNGEWSGEI